MDNEKFEKARKEIAKLNDNELGAIFTIVHQEMCKREAKKMILGLIDKEKQSE
jgi:hypothetical protein